MSRQSRPDDAGTAGTDEPLELSRRSLFGTAAGAGTAALLGSAAAGPATAQEDFGGWFTDDGNGGAVDNYDGTVADITGQPAVTIETGAEGNGGSFAFAPPAARVSPGTEVTFEWTSDTHNVLVEDQPDEAQWEGHEPIENTGFSFSHTFEAEGVYTYYCDPHLSLGMKGALVVGPPPGSGGSDGDATGGGGQEGSQPGGDLPEGVTTVEGAFVGLQLVALLTPFLLYYRERRRTVPAEYEPSEASDGDGVAEAPIEKPAREIDHDAYDPVGTLSTIVVYFLILVAMWVFTYFVEFLGNGPTVIG